MKIAGIPRRSPETYPLPPGAPPGCSPILLRYTFNSWSVPIAANSLGDAAVTTSSVPDNTTTVVGWVEDVFDHPGGIIQAGVTLSTPPPNAVLQFWLGNMTDADNEGGFTVTWVVACYTCPVIPGVIIT